MLDKIKKLLRLARDEAASPHEAANALTKALELASREGIDIESVNTDEEDSTTTHNSFPCSVFGDAEKLAAMLMREYFSVEVIIGHAWFFLKNRMNNLRKTG